ncbi:hypothetical protein CPB83DRAFT_863137 [Crepidotus variabilis]|uniref:ubiquitinyl hydrolase 1 n=1 Tax=Crepidotus variabilis TaxID=179855 RepID=A0A9P6E657_9AGAR|nr:hypothetical protein CPB83DRAFT_863137 [Crepidotus variabilis]
MAKTKAPTPQEIYRQRRQREERERVAYLPPGLINHGNTCFMNSVLQGLIATRVLADLVYFNPIPEEIQNTSATPIVSTRSPQLTNGHVFAGPYKQPYVDAMPIGDMFLNTVYKAWGVQAGRRREVLSPRNLLTTLGRKYDQYLDFAQQDAHEFLRILLDAMRMEEFDLIKQRQPLPPLKKRRRTTITHSSLRESQDSAISDLSPQIEIAGTPSGSQLTTPNGSALPHDSLPLMSFVDMVFGGRLTSILVCQKCKHVSQTYEDFNDISLSIKPEDYAPHRKRERLKKFVGRLTTFPGAAASAQKDKPVISGSDNSLVPNHTVELLRSANGALTSSGDKEPKLPGGSTEEVANEALKKRDLDTDTTLKALTGTSTEKTKTMLSVDAIREDDAENASDSSHVLVNIIGPEEKHVEFVESRKDKDNGMGEKDAKESKEKKEDSWVKIGRRISLNIGLGRPKDKEKDKEKDKKERDRKARSMDRGFLSVAAIKEAVSPESPSMQKSQSGGALSSLAPESSAPKSRVSSDSVIRPATSSVAEFPSTSKHSRPLPPAASLSTNSISTSSPKRNLSPLRPASTKQTPSTSAMPPPRSKSPKPPKPSSAEQEYLKKILADVASPSANPFTIFRPPLPHRHASDHPSIASSSSDKDKDKSGSAAWLGLGVRPFTGIEECLRLFTSVEVLDGENMVGCRRCWKIQNGALNPSKRDDSDADEDEDEEDVPMPIPIPIEVEDRDQSQKPPLTVLPPSLNLSTTSNSSPVQLHASHSTPTVSFYSNTDRRSVSSLPISVSDVNLSMAKETRSPEDSPDSPLSLSVISESSVTTGQTTESETAQIQGPGGLPIPVIMTTTETIVPSETNASTPNESSSESQYSSASEGLSQSSEALMMAAATSAVNGRHPPNTQHVSYSKDSLVIPTRSRYGNRKAAETPNTTDEGSSGDESDTSVGTSVSAESGFANGHQPLVKASSSQSAATSPGQAQPKPQKKPSKPKPTLMRPAYKRYLIATPPPILVIHLKRFQQTSKSPLMMSFSHGFKKLDDYVSFPEHLDLSPFLAPRKEDYGLGKKGRSRKAKDKIREKISPKEEPCMYRLYAVVVHIGNMLGGHYVAYTALPTKPPLHHSSSAGTSAADPASASSTTNTPSSEKPTSTTSAPEPEPPVAREWAYISDTTVRLTSLEEVLNSKAYLCMYERC